MDTWVRKTRKNSEEMIALISGGGYFWREGVGAMVG